MSFLQRLFRRPTVDITSKSPAFQPAKPSGETEGSEVYPAAAHPSPVAPEWLIVGLGNPGERYAATRHNVGWMALDALCEPGTGSGADVSTGAGGVGKASDDVGEDAESTSAAGRWCQGSWEPAGAIPGSVRHLNIDGVAVALLRPSTFMNDSGAAVGPLAALWELPPERVVVLHDELDLPPGVVRIKRGGNENGHNGLKSVTSALGTREYLRVRIGIGRPATGVPVPEYVLSNFETPSSELDVQLDRAALAARMVVEAGLAKAQQRIHSLR